MKKGQAEIYAILMAGILVILLLIFVYFSGDRNGYNRGYSEGFDKGFYAGGQEVYDSMHCFANSECSIFQDNDYWNFSNPISRQVNCTETSYKAIPSDAVTMCMPYPTIILNINADWLGVYQPENRTNISNVTVVEK